MVPSRQPVVDTPTPPVSAVPVAHRWNAVVWVLFGLLPPAIAVSDAAPGVKFTTYGLLAVLTFSYAAVAMFPGNPVLRPPVYLTVLAVGIGAVAYVMGSGAALFIVSLPHFWIYASGPAAALSFSGGAAVLTALASAAGRDPEPRIPTGDAAFIALGYLVGAGVGLLVHRISEQGEERAQRLTNQLADTQAELAEAHRRQGAADERERLAREIHDTLAQGFASIIVLAEAARAGLTSEPGRATQQLTSIEQTARENLAEARALVGATPPPGGAVQGSVSTTLRRILDRFAEDTGIAVDAELADADCDQQTRIALLRCTQESLANVRKHAGASTVIVVLAHGPYGIDLEITDDGRGFDVGAARGFGLDGMRKRLAELGGELTVTSSLGDGTRILASLPTFTSGHQELV
ncbi:sensor histidine kinase [Streptomyces kunmingensis]|uniref:Oxygen sensor histidine kinase NreB n=1 Tax=Streptomyces kunmingensis TaxID=68225 RepID=A0ABU6CCE5_9ACTN|nr:sensor histidine kinase [Streptomyces kunmingensis]MEB3961851.1 sensor histidine kinase [Streptomyces kunmingensis]